VSTATEAVPVWIDRTAAARLLDVDPRTVSKLAEAGKIAVRDLPTRSRYFRSDVERLAAESVRPVANGTPWPVPMEANACMF
jgi:hypothetical protein